MSTHPFIRRIRAEREILAVINAHSERFGCELSGLGVAAIEKWSTNLPEDVFPPATKSVLLQKLVSISTLTRLSSNGSHRGAMVAPASNEEIVMRLTQELKETLFSSTN